MFFRYLRFVLISLISLVLSLFLTTYPWLSVIASSPPLNSINQSQRLEQAKQWYQQGQLNLAIETWREIVIYYEEQGDQLNQAHILTYLALAYSQLGAWKDAEESINDSLTLLQETIKTKTEVCLPILAEALNVQGTLFLAKGDALSALSSWEKATNTYEQVRDESGIFRTKINQSMALKALGSYSRACEKLVEIFSNNSLTCKPLNLKKINDLFSSSLESLSSIKIAGWSSLGEVLKEMAELDSSQFIFETLLEKSPATEQQASLLVNLAKTLELQGNIEEAQEKLIRAIALSKNSQTQVKAQLIQLQLLINQKQWNQIEALVSNLVNQISQLPLNQTKIDAQLTLAQRLIEIKSPSWQEIDQLLLEAQKNSETIGYIRGQAFSLGNQGELYEQLALSKVCYLNNNNLSRYRQQTPLNCHQVYQFTDIKQLEAIPSQLWKKATQFTEQALRYSQALQAPEMTYLWQWQLGRILAESGQTGAIEAYLAAIETLETITNQLGTNREFQFSFQEKVEPLYRQLLSLLLPRNNQDSVPQEQLVEARQQIEALQAAELNNFFRDVCVQSEPVAIEDIDPQAAVIYPLILRDRLVVLLSLPKQPLQAYVVPIEQEELEKILRDFRYNIVIRSQREFFINAEQLYDWLIRPFNQRLQQSSIKTLIFVADGVFRNVPLAALYDGQQYLIENYGVSLTPGLTLLSPESLQQKGLNTLFAGLTAETPKDGFIPLFYVQQELQAVKSQVPSLSLLNEQFTLSNLQDNLQDNFFPILHFATHGQFSSQFEETFLLAWNSRINILQLERLLKESAPTQRAAIELLILSACETATGDRRAALGLAGFAVRAGARSTLATLWSVNDQGTALLMEQLYNQLAQQKISKAEALRQAQLVLLKDRWYRHPFYWSPYILVGNWL